MDHTLIQFHFQTHETSVPSQGNTSSQWKSLNLAWWKEPFPELLECYKKVVTSHNICYKFCKLVIEHFFHSCLHYSTVLCLSSHISPISNPLFHGQSLTVSYHLPIIFPSSLPLIVTLSNWIYTFITTLVSSNLSRLKYVNFPPLLDQAMYCTCNVQFTDIGIFYLVSSLSSIDIFNISISTVSISHIHAIPQFYSRMKCSITVTLNPLVLIKKNMPHFSPEYQHFTAEP